MAIRVNTVNVKKCKTCGKEFPLTGTHFFRRQSLICAKKYWDSDCKKCVRTKRNQQYADRKSSALKDLQNTQKTPEKRTSKITIQNFPVESLKGNRCLRCGGFLELRNLKYDFSELPVMFEGDCSYYNCVFCGQDYYKSN